MAFLVSTLVFIFTIGAWLALDSLFAAAELSRISTNPRETKLDVSLSAISNPAATSTVARREIQAARLAFPCDVSAGKLANVINAFPQYALCAIRYNLGIR